MKLRTYAFGTEHFEKLNQVKEVYMKALWANAYNSRLSQKEYCQRYGFSQARLSEILNFKYDKVTLDRLCMYLAKVCPDFSFNLSISSIHTVKDSNSRWRSLQSRH